MTTLLLGQLPAWAVQTLLFLDSAVTVQPLAAVQALPVFSVSVSLAMRLPLAVVQGVPTQAGDVATLSSVLLRALKLSATATGGSLTATTLTVAVWAGVLVRAGRAVPALPASVTVKLTVRGAMPGF